MLSIICAFSKLSSLTADHHKKYNNNGKVINIVKITEMWQRHKESKCYEKNGADRLHDTGLPQICKKKKAITTKQSVKAQ